MNEKSRFSPTELVGVTKIQEIFLRDFNWIPRIQFVADFGIDMIVETTKESSPTGKLIAVQIKTGESYFKETTKSNIIYRTDLQHIDYWLNHSLPVIIVLYNDRTNSAYWQVVNKHTLLSTGKGYKIIIPKSNLLERNALVNISKVNEFSKPIQRFIEFSLYKPLMQKIADGNKIVLELDEWVNKLSGKAVIKIIQVLNDRENEEGIVNSKEEKTISEIALIGISSYLTLFKIYPWADFKTDQLFYEEFSDYDDDNMPGYKIVFIEDRYHQYKLPIIPYYSNGEVDKYRLEMSLNTVGKSFLNLYNSFENGIQLSLL